MHPNMDKWIIPVYGTRPATLSRLFAKATRSQYSCLPLCLTLMMDSLLFIWAFLDLWLGQPCAKIIHLCTWGVCYIVSAEHCLSQVRGVFPVGCVEGVHGSSDRQSGGHPATAHCVPVHSQPPRVAQSLALWHSLILRTRWEYEPHTHLGLACHRGAIIHLQHPIQPISVQCHRVPGPKFDFGLTYDGSDPSSTVKPGRGQGVERKILE